MKESFIRLIVFYQKNISPFLGGHCKFIPSCSEYTKEAILKYGVGKGILKGMKRILRCNPFSQGGIDLP